MKWRPSSDGKTWKLEGFPIRVRKGCGTFLLAVDGEPIVPYTSLGAAMEAGQRRAEEGSKDKDAFGYSLLPGQEYISSPFGEVPVNADGILFLLDKLRELQKVPQDKPFPVMMKGFVYANDLKEAEEKAWKFVRDNAAKISHDLYPTFITVESP